MFCRWLLVMQVCGPMPSLLKLQGLEVSGHRFGVLGLGYGIFCRRRADVYCAFAAYVVFEALEPLGALIIRTGYWGPLYYNYKKEV